jgi:hypothetical protein
MPSEKFYFETIEDTLDGCHLMIHITKDNGLYVEVGRSFNGCELQNIVLPNEDAEEIIRELADDLGYTLSRKPPLA